MFRPISINVALNGWIVTVGCQTVVYQDRNQLVSDLDAYLKDPGATEIRFLKTSVNQAHTGGGAMAGPIESQARDAVRRDFARDRHAEALGVMPATTRGDVNG